MDMGQTKIARTTAVTGDQQKKVEFYPILLRNTVSTRKHHILGLVLPQKPYFRYGTDSVNLADLQIFLQELCLYTYMDMRINT